ncbi:MAG: hypothetical protein IMZ73_01085 [Chloroflexi bacterium]|nr:hypothetical protein [Chloroflexota bacterium]
MVRRNILAVIMVLALIGVVDSSYAMYQHYAPADISACDVNETINCTAINQSEYSAFFQIPVAGVGAAGYLLMAALATGMMTRRFRPNWALSLLMASALVAVAFSAWLTYIELFVLKAVCPLCVLSMTLVTTITVLLLVDVVRGRRSNRDGVRD